MVDRCWFRSMNVSCSSVLRLSLVLLSLALVGGRQVNAETRLAILDQRIRPGTVIKVPVSIESDQEVFGAQFDVVFDASVLVGSNASPVDAAPGDLVVHSQLIDPGRFRMVVFRSGTEPLAAGSQVALEFVIPADVQEGSLVVGLENVGAGGVGALANVTGQSGTLSVELIPEEIIVSGRISYPESELGVPEVILRAEGAAEASGFSDADGHYNLAVASEKPFSLKPEFAGSGAASLGVTSLDLLLLRRHVLGVAPFASVWQRLAGDVDRTGDIGALDLLLMRRLILGQEDYFVADRSLVRFVPTDYEFDDLFRPWATPDARDFEGLTEDLDGQDFVVLKLGDVDGDWRAGVGSPLVDDAVVLQSVSWGGFPGIEFWIEPAMEEGSREEYRVFSLKTQSVELLSSLQFTLTWDPELLAFDKIIPAGLDVNEAREFGLTLLDEGVMTFVWASDQSLQGPKFNQSCLFQVAFRALSGDEGHLDWGDAPTPRFVSVGDQSVPFRVRHPEVQSFSEVPAIALSSEAGGRSLSIVQEGVDEGRFVLEYTVSLVRPVWRVLIERESHDGVLVFADPIAPGESRFYRIKKTDSAGNGEVPTR